MANPRLRKLAPTWPLTLLFAGLPVWWLLGVWQIMFFVMAVPMAAYLMRQRSIEMPRGFGLWLLFIGWLLTGYLVLQVDAPGAVPGNSANRYITFSYRLGWYAISAIVALYVVNTRRLITTHRIACAVAWLFVMLIIGGTIGLLAPNLSFPSALQTVLPGGIASHPFVHSLIHVQFAQVHHFLSEPQARPSAPFAVTNEWGLATVMTLPFFVIAWWKRGGPWRVAMLVILAAAVVAIVSSLNRGVWAAVLAILLFLVGREVLRARVQAVLALIAIAILGTIAVTSTPLGDLVSERFDNQHSNERRSSLGTLALESTADGSPVVGFGTTRYVAGNFTSIAGGATPDCPSCEPPPLGTQGQLWLVSFGSGFVGLALFLSFLLYQFLGNLGIRSTYGAAALSSLLVLFITMPIYNSIGVALYVGLIAVGILARDSHKPLPELNALVRPLLRRVPTLLVIVTLGGLLGLAAHAHLGGPTRATLRIFVPEADLNPVPGVRPLSLDSEAQLLRSDPVLQAAASEIAASPPEIASALHISAEPNTRVLRLSFTHSDADVARQGVELVAAAYLANRQVLIDTSKASITDAYQDRLDTLDEIYRETYPRANLAAGSALWDTIGQLRQDSGAASETLLDASNPQVGQVISGVTSIQSNDALLVRLASGLGLGGLIAVPAIRLYDSRFTRLGRRPEERLGLQVPVVASPTSVGDLSTQRTVRSYLPLAGVLADPNRSAALRASTELNHGIPRAGDHSGARTLLVVDRNSKVGDVRELHQRCLESSLHPVGLIVCDTEGSHREERIAEEGK